MARRNIKKRIANRNREIFNSPIHSLHTDLHMHSTASDGRLTPQDVLESALVGGLDVIALTDHDVYPQLQFGLHHLKQTAKKTSSNLNFLIRSLKRFLIFLAYLAIHYFILI